jgi:quinol monooxygenase YgiN
MPDGEDAMYLIAARLRARPERRDELVELARGMLLPSRNEEGCLRYDFHVDVFDPLSFLFFEEWISRDAIDAHFETPHFREFRKRIEDLVDGEPRISIHEVVRTE